MTYFPIFTSRISVRRLFIGRLAISFFAVLMCAVTVHAEETIPAQSSLPTPVSTFAAAPPLNPVPPSILRFPTPNGPIEVQRFRSLQWSPEGSYIRAQGGVEVLFTNPRDKTPVTMKAQTLDYNPDEQSVHAQGSVSIAYTDPGANHPTTLNADRLDYSGDTGIFTAGGNVRLERSEGVFTGDEIAYDFNSQSGYVTNAYVVSDYFRLRGKRIETIFNGTTPRYVITDGAFTTCFHGQPDYQFHAHRLTYIPNRYLSARHVTFYAGRTGLFTLPSYRRDLRGGSGSNPAPTPGYNRSEGFTLRFRDTPLSQPHRIVDYDARLSFTEFPPGFISYQQDIAKLVPLRPNAQSPRGLLDTLEDPLRGFLEQLTPPTYREYTESRYAPDYEKRATGFAMLQNEQGVYNRSRNDLSVSRFPEVGIRFNNILGHNPPPGVPILPNEKKDGTQPPVGDVSPVLQRIPNAPFLLDVAMSLGAFDEQPTRVTSGRLGGRINFATQPLLLARRLSLRAGATDWLSIYTRGSIYNLLSPEVALNYAPTSTSVLGAGYRYLTDLGRTPFAFDRRDIRQELRLQYQVGGPWAFGVVSRIDLERARAYEAEYAVIRNFDCMQVGFAYRARSRSLNIIFNILPPLRNTARRSPLGPRNL